MSQPRTCPKCGPKVTLDARQIVGETHSHTNDTPQLSQVDIDVCPSCRGVWLDWGELGRLRDLRNVLDELQSNMRWKDDLRGGQCPVCDQALGRIDVGAFGVDRCAKCSGLWFDGGELGPMLSEQGFSALLQALLTARKTQANKA